MTIKRFGFEPKKGYKSNCDSDDSDTESSTSDANSTANNNNNNNSKIHSKLYFNRPMLLLNYFIFCIEPQFKPRPIGTLNENFKWVYNFIHKNCL